MLKNLVSFLSLLTLGFGTSQDYEECKGTYAAWRYHSNFKDTGPFEILVYSGKNLRRAINIKKVKFLLTCLG